MSRQQTLSERKARNGFWVDMERATMGFLLAESPQIATWNITIASMIVLIAAYHILKTFTLGVMLSVGKTARLFRDIISNREVSE